MKKQFVTLVQKLNKVTLVMAALAVTTSAFAGNGGGYSGPDLSGVSIPLKVDRAVKYEVFSKAFETCLASGDKSRGITPLLHKVARQIFGAKLTGLSVVANSQLYHEQSSHTLVGVGEVTFSRGEDTVAWITNSFYLDGANGDQQRKPIAMGLNFNHPAKDSTLIDARSADTVLPYLTYDEVVMDKAYDDWGVYSEGEKLYRGFRLVIPGTLIENVGFVTTSRSTDGVSAGRSLPISLNVREYAQCLQSELQRVQP